MGGEWDNFGISVHFEPVWMMELWEYQLKTFKTLKADTVLMLLPDNKELDKISNFKVD